MIRILPKNNPVDIRLLLLGFELKTFCVGGGILMEIFGGRDSDMGQGQLYDVTSNFAAFNREVPILSRDS